MDNRRGRNPNQYYRGRNRRAWRRGGPVKHEPQHHDLEEQTHFNASFYPGARQWQVDTNADVMTGDDNREYVDNSRRFHPYNASRRRKRRPNYRGGRGSSRRGFHSTLSQDDSTVGSYSRGDSWSKVMLPMARRQNRDELVKTLTERCPVPLVIYNIHFNGSAVMFYVRDMSTAVALKNLHGKVTIGDGFKLKILVHGADSPHMCINDEANKSLKNCVQRRYTPKTRGLDLSYIHHDVGMNSEGFVLSLKFSNVANVVSLAINEIIPEVHYLNLAGNNLTNLDILNRTSEKLTNLQVLILDSNKLTALNKLDSINGIALEELSLKDNLLLLPNETAWRRYVADIRGRFPKLLRLDGQELPPQSGFDVERPISLPPKLDSFFVSDLGRRIALQFFANYFSLYDTNRPGVADCYHLDAVFSLVTVKSEHIRGATLSNYYQHSRNLLSEINQDRRIRLLFQGVWNIVEMLNSLPKTNHDTGCDMIMDVIASTDKFTSVSICGVFRELETSVTKNDLYRAFNRSFILVPIDGRLKIVNDMLLITIATPDQKNLAMKNLASKKPVPSTSAVVPNILIKQEMTVKQEITVKQEKTESFSERVKSEH